MWITLWISLWISYEIHLIPYGRPGESDESHLNQLFLLISGGFYHGFHEIQHNITKSNRISWNPENSKYFMKSNRTSPKSTRFHEISQHFTGYNLNQQDFIMDSTLDSIPVADPQMPEIWQSSENPPDFMKSTGFYAWNPLNQIIQEKTLHFHRVQGAYVIWNL